MAAAEKALTDYAETASRLAVPPHDVMAITTSAARRASNANEWFEHIRHATGLRFRIISGDEEARLTWAGATSDVAITGKAVVFDLGGGSTEVVTGDSAGLDARISLEVGSVRHTEAFLGYEAITNGQRQALRDCLRAEVAGLPFDIRCTTVIGVAGTVTTLAAMTLGLDDWDSARVHHSVLSKAALQRWSDTLASADRDERARLAAVSPKRADFLVAGAEILLALLDACEQDEMLVSDRGIRYGLFATNQHH